MNIVATLTAILEKSKSRHLQGNGGVWCLDGNSREATRLKEELLQAICDEVSPVVHYDEDPPAEGSLGSSIKVARSAWRIPKGTKSPELLSWLYMGNWQLYVGPDVLTSLPDLCRSSRSEIESFVRQSQVVVVIDSFHDEVSWSIGLAQNVA